MLCLCRLLPFFVPCMLWARWAGSISDLESTEKGEGLLQEAWPQGAGSFALGFPQNYTGCQELGRRLGAEEAVLKVSPFSGATPGNCTFPPRAGTSLG